MLSRSKSCSRQAVEQHSICLLTLRINLSPLCLSDSTQAETPKLSHSWHLCIISSLPPSLLIIDRGGCLLVQYPCNPVIIRKDGWPEVTHAPKTNGFKSIISQFFNVNLQQVRQEQTICQKIKYFDKHLGQFLCYTNRFFQLLKCEDYFNNLLQIYFWGVIGLTIYTM